MTEPIRPEELRRASAPPSSRWQSSAKWTLVAVVLVVVLGGLGFYLLALS